jgi:hypothetical protein
VRVAPPARCLLFPDSDLLTARQRKGATSQRATSRDVTLHLGDQAPSSPSDTTKEDFEAAERIDTPGAWDAFIARHPDGYYAVLAKERRTAIAAKTAALPSSTDVGSSAPSAQPETRIKLLSPLQGAMVSSITSNLAREFGLDSGAEGLIVTNSGDSTAANIGFQRGDIIRFVNNEKISTASDLERIAVGKPRHWRINFVRGKNEINFTM